ncbi:hypothetical protein Fcan01_28530 [Folsomia candida]|uniref:Uncharacterized protein n=1 Tax=Folsomia candida TaxID=158441 RepID=A0A226CTE5_FOLCA|nr:hypothetical protein Fcan01_28530 [Folsomia candida]
MHISHLCSLIPDPTGNRSHKFNQRHFYQLVSYLNNIMQSSHRKIFTFTLSIFVVILTLGLSKGSFNQESQTIQILSHPLLTLAEAHDYDVSTCKPVIYNAPGGYVNGIKNRGICVNIYPADNCTGWFTRLTYGEHSGAYLPQTYRWDGEDLMNRTLQIASVGPCFDKCDARNWQDDRREAVKVTLYDDYGFQGNATNINVDSDECILIPPPSGRLLSMKISGDRNCCIELHSAPNCGEEFTQFRPDYPELRTMYFWNLGAKDTYAAHARAVSRCGQFCDKSVPEINPESGTSPGKKVVTFYSHPGYYGIF